MNDDAPTPPEDLIDVSKSFMEHIKTLLDNAETVMQSGASTQAKTFATDKAKILAMALCTERVCVELDRIGNALHNNNRIAALQQDV